MMVHHHSCAEHWSLRFCLSIFQCLASIALVGCQVACFIVFFFFTLLVNINFRSLQFQKFVEETLLVMLNLMSFHLQAPDFNIITEYIDGYAYPKFLVTNMCFKVYGFNNMTQTLIFVFDFKLGHYMKFPPKAIFMTRMNFLQPLLQHQI